MTPILPPLPELPGEGVQYRYLPPGDSIITLLAEDHEMFNAYCSHLAAHPTVEGANILVASLCRHLSGERQYLYPAVANAVPTDGPAAVAQQLADDMRMLSQVDTFCRAELSSPPWHQALGRIHEAIHAHERYCARHLFSPLQALISDADLIRLGNRLQIAIEAAPSRPHLWAPIHAPMNKLTDALIGIADKVRDLATGRRTFPRTSKIPLPNHPSAGKIRPVSRQATHT